MTGDVGGIFWKFFMFLLIKGFIFAYFREKIPPRGKHGISPGKR
jgi:hypothetical protein